MYELHMGGWSTIQIARSLGVDHSNVSRALAIIRKRNAGWYDKNKDPDHRFRSLFKQIYDHFALTIREAWTMFYNTPAEKPEARDHLLARVQRGLELQCKLLGVTSPSLDDLYFQEEMDKAHATLAGAMEKYRKFTEE